MGEITAVENVTQLALRLPPVDRLRLVERIMAATARDLAQDELERDGRLLAEAKAQATEFVDLEEAIEDYERETGHDLLVKVYRIMQRGEGY